MGHQIVRKYGHLVQILEMPPAIAAKGQGKISRADLGAFEKEDFTSVVIGNIIEIRHFSKQLDQAPGG